MSVIPIVSSRMKFYKAGVISKSEKTRLVNLSDPRPSNNKLISNGKLLNIVNGKHVVVLVHGYNNTFNEICDAYLRVTNQLNTNTVPHDEVIGYVWPGGNKKLGYLGAKQRARQLSRRISKLLNSLIGSASSVDIVAHSMGCFLFLESMKKSNKAKIRNIYLMASAVNNYGLSDGLHYSNAVSHCKGIYIFKSTDDSVLRRAFPIGEKGDKALGYTGPIPLNTVVDNALTVDCSGKQDPIEHGSYSRRTEIYEFMNNNQGPIASPNETTL